VGQLMSMGFCVLLGTGVFALSLRDGDAGTTSRGPVPGTIKKYFGYAVGVSSGQLFQWDDPIDGLHATNPLVEITPEVIVK
jgi:hypothetical protein